MLLITWFIAGQYNTKECGTAAVIIYKQLDQHLAD